MNINAVSFEEHGSGYNVTLRIWIGKKEAEDFNLQSLGPHMLRHLASNLEDSEGEDGETEVSPEAADDDSEIYLAKHARQNDTENADGSREGLEQDQEENEEKPTSVSRRRRRNKAADPTEMASSGVKTAGSRRKRKTESAKTATKSPSDEDEISDSDLSKAASLAAEDMDGDIDAVMEVLEEFGVSKVGDIAQNVRREFLNKLQEVKNNWISS